MSESKAVTVTADQIIIDRKALPEVTFGDWWNGESAPAAEGPDGRDVKAGEWTLEDFTRDGKITTPAVSETDLLALAAIYAAQEILPSQPPRAADLDREALADVIDRGAPWSIDSAYARGQALDVIEWLKGQGL